MTDDFSVVRYLHQSSFPFLKSRLLLFLVVVLILAGGVSCNQTEQAREPDTVTLQLKWSHQAQFAGYYMAKELGFYSDENLDVSFLEGGPEIGQASSLRNGTAQFAVVPAESLLLNNEKEHRIIAIAVIYQHNPTMFVSKKDSGIVTPFDMVGKRIAIGELEHGGFIEGHIELYALFKQLELDFSSIKTSPYDPQYRSFLADEVDITPAYLVGGVMKLNRQGIDLNMIWPGDYGIDLYSDTIAATADYIRNNRNIVKRFLKASLKGWEACIKDQELAVDITMKYVKVKDRELQTQMMKNQIPLVHTGDSPIGWMTPAVWQTMYSSYYEHNLIKQPIHDISAIHSMYFLKEIYDRGPE